MKKSLLIIALVCGLGWTAMAQLPTRVWGGGISYGPNIEKMGLNLRTYQYYKSNIRVGSELNIFAPYQHPNRVPITDYLAEGMVNLHYLLPVSPKLTVYPIGGIHIKFGLQKSELIAPEDINTLSFYTGLDIGTGVQYKLGDKVYLFGEYKYSTSKDYNRGVPTFGIMVHTAGKN